MNSLSYLVYKSWMKMSLTCTMMKKRLKRLETMQLPNQKQSTESWKKFLKSVIACHNWVSSWKTISLIWKNSCNLKKRIWLRCRSRPKQETLFWNNWKKWNMKPRKMESITCRPFNPKPNKLQKMHQIRSNHPLLERDHDQNNSAMKKTE